MGIESAHKYSEEELTGILKKLSAEDNGYGNILRAKGIVPATEGEWFHFDLVPGEYEVRGAVQTIPDESALLEQS